MKELKTGFNLTMICNYKSIVLNIGLIFLCSCDSINFEQNITAGDKKNIMKKLDYKIPESCNFDEIEHAFSSNACSPKIIKPEYQGVVINAPKTLVLKDDMEAYVACSFSFSNKTN